MTDSIHGINGASETVNPLDSSSKLRQPSPGVQLEPAHPQQRILPGDSATTRAEKIERNGTHAEYSDDGDGSPPAKRQKVDTSGIPCPSEPRERMRGVAQVKSEYLIHVPGRKSVEDGDRQSGGKNKSRNKDRGQNTARTFGSSRDSLQLCMSRSSSPEFSPRDCKFGDKCKYEHDLRRYLKEGKREDVTTFSGMCPIWDAKGTCSVGWRCRFVGSHSKERDTEDGRKELVLLEDAARRAKSDQEAVMDEGVGVVNIVSSKTKMDLKKHAIKTPKADAYNDWLIKRQKEVDDRFRGKDGDKDENDSEAKGGTVEERATNEILGDNRARYTEPPFLPSEKKRIYYGPETPVLAPLTTQGNLPFRRLCVELGAQVTWSEMAMGLPLLQGEKSEWALMKAHESETLPPRYRPTSVVEEYDNSRDLRFGAQIAGNKPWNTLKTTEVLTALCPHLRAIDLNCGCPIDLVYRQGAGSALLDSPGKLEKMLRGMNAVSQEIPVTVKIRMGTKDGKPTAEKLVERLALGGPEIQQLGEGPAGVAAITLHGRSRQQRYTRKPDPRQLSSSNNGKVYFVGNGDCYSHVDYNEHIAHGKVDSVMVARGALIKPWIFEEIEQGQYLDKSATQRLAYIEKYAKYGLENWGSDEIGVGITRRFLLEWLSFACRYVPVGLLEHLPPHIQDRPPAHKGRNELETLLSSDNYKDWIKIR
ncbi:hypothetical protein LTR04_002222 [Oleoguttula sp. CCFEE 6159]|nr:hypothetical protein LTR04_002222 [Oleoguttula sp. CCFEE 6159]